MALTRTSIQAGMLPIGFVPFIGGGVSPVGVEPTVPSRACFRYTMETVRWYHGPEGSTRARSSPPSLLQESNPRCLITKQVLCH